jgi:hypothetical protein
MSNSETVTIPKAEYDRLVKDSDKLAGLEAGGVDNWSWYYESLADWRKKYYPDEDEE